MLKNIKLEEKILLKNTSYLFFFQVLNSLMPLIILPYVIQSISIEKYGSVIFIQTFVAYFLMVTEYGFGISATKDIAFYRDDSLKVDKIFNTVLLAKFYLALIGFLLFILILVVFKTIFEEDLYVYIYAYLLVFAMAISPTWLFQGFENMKTIVISNFFVKLFFILSIILFIKKEDDFSTYILLYSLSYLFLGFLLLFIAKKTYSISFYRVNFNEIYKELKKSFHYFTSKISSTLYLNNNIFFLGIFGTVTGLGYYAIAEKIIRALVTLMAPLNQASIPYISRSFSKNEDYGIQKSKQLLIFTLLGMSFVTIVIYFLAPLMVHLLTGQEGYSPEIVYLIKIMSLIPLFGIIGYFIAYNLLAHLGLMKFVPKIMIVAAIVNTILNFLLIPYYDAYGAAISILFTEGLLLFMFMYVYKKTRCITK